MLPPPDRRSQSMDSMPGAAPIDSMGDRFEQPPGRPWQPNNAHWGGGNWGTLRIPREDWGNLRKHEGKPFQK